MAQAYYPRQIRQISKVGKQLFELTLSRCGSRKNYIPSPEDPMDSSQGSEEGDLWKPSALNAWTISEW
jgi:hypothetical protein